MNATVLASTSVPVSLQFSIPLLILGNLTRGYQEPTEHSGGQATQRLDDRIETFGLPTGYSAYPDVGVAYKLNRTQVTWHEARERCSSEGGYLAVVDSQQKFDIIQKIISADDIAYPWIGVHNFFKSHEWYGINNGSPVSFFKWNYSYPSNIEKAHCVFLIYLNREAKHVNWSCDNFYPYVCEIPLTKNCN